MYGPAHVSTALTVKRVFPVAPLLGLRLGTQAIELVWVVPTNRATLPTIILLQMLVCMAILWLLARRTAVASPDRAPNGSQRGEPRGPRGRG